MPDLSHIPDRELREDLAAAQMDLLTFLKLYTDTSVRVYHGRYTAQEVIDGNRQQIAVIEAELARRTSAAQPAAAEAGP